MNWSVSVLSAHTADTHPSLVVTFDSGKYIFNTGENTTRAFLQSHRGWKRSRAVVLTRVDTRRALGLPGFLMTLADASTARMTVVAPQGLMHYLASMRLYFYRNTLSLSPIEVPISRPSSSDAEAVYKDENMSIYALRLSPPSPSPVPIPTPIPSSTSAERKRKRPQTGPASLAPAIPQTFLSKISSLSNLDPERLRGPERDWWRWIVVERMFKDLGVPAPEGPKKESRAAKKQKIGTTRPAEASQEEKAAVLPGWWRRLPTFSLGSSEPIPSNGAPAEGPVLSYILVGPRVRGKFNAKRADELGLGPGPLRAKVARGETVTFTVTLPDGTKEERTVTPQDCLGASEAPAVVAILDVPSPSYIPSLVTELKSSPVLSGNDGEKYNIRLVVHLCGDDVWGNQYIQGVVRCFPASVHHLVSSKKHSPNPVTFTSAGYAQLKLNQLDPDMFPLPQFNLEPEFPLDGTAPPDLNIQPLRSNILIDIRPPRAPVHEHEADERDLFHPGIIAPAENPVLGETTAERFTRAKEIVKEKEERMKQAGRPAKPGDDVLVVPLGTSSAMTTKYRNVSGTMITIPGYGNILLDAGEGSYGQLARSYGPGEEGVEKVLRELRCIFVSHAHADHHIGLARVLAEHRQLDPPPPPLYLVANEPILLYLSEYSDLEEIGWRDGSVRTISSETLAVPSSDSRMDSIHSHYRYKLIIDVSLGSQETVESLYAALGLKKFLTVSMRHRVRCYGCVIEHLDGWSIAYSGDTMPSMDLVNAAKNATLLIHEATMADEEAEMAAVKAHSTIGQAVDIGTKMNAENILLTHFSARYPKMPPSLTEPKDSNSAQPIIAVAFDNARIRIGDMWKLNTYLSAIESSFEETPDADDETEKGDKS
ncbi:hypothetical protein GLOTRDRAFT_78506 [Gloeophyllum trabeum ATCC 11539]|uniref:ribonuclease Z n=1 Tax=Gloeophyllum trabeum (strain ATCC 11539 / FP-39264 / Madison 617) TaxID=670483 RepID=S7Q0Q4_GLOTA|nr:uncharacterized protein GLOTRDRAFT_78506 [Gloeophyllum trabeum ATCC 11539]EPQ53491.1 hypothetical protein GLOTRDRAFT_78506 [Gloeophyllum trabeum ATCC 11539]